MIRSRNQVRCFTASGRRGARDGGSPESSRRYVCTRMCDVMICNLIHPLPDRGGNLIYLLSSSHWWEKKVFESPQIWSHPSCEIRLKKAMKMILKRHDKSEAALFMFI